MKFSRRSWMFILPVILINCVFYFPKLFEYEIVFAEGKYILKRTDLIDDVAYYYWAPIFVRYLFPIVALFFLNGSIIVTIYKTTKEAKQLQKFQSKYRQNTTRILLYIVMIFLICYSFQIARRIPDLVGIDEDISLWSLPLAWLAAIINSSINFLIYCMVGKKFREELFKLIKYT